MSGGETSARELPCVERVAESELEAAGRLAARAHKDDPCFAHVFPDPATSPRNLEALFCWLVRLGHQFGEVSRPTGSFDGVMVVFRWADWERHTQEEVFAMSDYARLQRELGEASSQRLKTEFHDRIFAAASGALEEHLDSDHWELDLLAVDPPKQGQGVGGRLLHHLNRQADQAGAQLGLITVNPRNPPFYERHGFTVLAEAIDQPSGVHWWSMGRVPSPS